MLFFKRIMLVKKQSFFLFFSSLPLFLYQKSNVAIGMKKFTQSRSIVAEKIV